MHEHEKRVLEGLLFLSGDEGLSIEQLNGCVEELDKKEIEVVLDELMQDYLADVHGIELVRFGGIYKFVSKEAIHPYAQKLFSSTKVATLSNAALETLAIIAYKQPVTKLEIEKIRGVKSDHAVNKLVEYNLVSERGRMDAPGKPILFGTTEEFLRRFSIHSLDDLPSPNPEQVETFKEEAEEEVQLKLDI